MDLPGSLSLRELARRPQGPPSPPTPTQLKCSPEQAIVRSACLGELESETSSVVGPVPYICLHDHAQCIQ